MSIEKIELLELDTKVYTFTVNVISFIKSLEKNGLFGGLLTKTIQVAACMSTDFPDMEEEKMDILDEGLENLLRNANICFEYIDNISCNSKMSDEKANLLIDLDEILKKIKEVRL